MHPPVPEVYDLKLSEKSVFDASMVERASALAKELRLSQEGAAKMLASIEAENAAQLDLQREANLPNGALWKARVAQYEADALEAPDLGAGDPAKLEKLAATAQRVAQELGGKDLMDMLGATGMGSHPVFLRLFTTIAQKFSEGEFVKPSAAPSAGSVSDPALILFGGSQKPAAQE